MAEITHNLLHDMSIVSELYKPYDCHGRVDW